MAIYEVTFSCHGFNDIAIQVKAESAGSAAILAAAGIDPRDPKYARIVWVPAKEVIETYKEEVEFYGFRGDFYDWLDSTNYVEASMRSHYNSELEANICPDGYYEAIKIQSVDPPRIPAWGY